MEIKRNFASDNTSGIHPDVLQAIIDANVGYVAAYGEDPYTEAAIKKFKEHFGEEIDVYFTYSGTATNVLSYQTVTESFNAIICPETAHANSAECGAPEKFTGCKLITIPTKDGKISVEQFQQHVPSLETHDDREQHHSQPKVISITQATELGTVYRPDDIRALADFAHKHEMLLHIDGARISNAAASLGLGFREITTDVGVDILSFGGTKNGLMFAEAVIFFNRSLSKNFKYIRKQGMQLASKMRFISAQFIAFLSDDLWRENAERANAMAKRLANEIKKIPEVEITQKVESNVVFATIPKRYVSALREKYSFYLWDEDRSEARLMCSFNTTEEDIIDLVKARNHQVKSD